LSKLLPQLARHPWHGGPEDLVDPGRQGPV
jgi:hypothetical protein